MAFGSWLSQLFGIWPRDLPRFYPNEDALSLASFMSEDEYKRIKQFATCYILPFASEEDGPEETAFGISLSHLMIRNLMLLRDVSIHGPEDTPQFTRETAHEYTPDFNDIWVTGKAAELDSGYRLEFDVLQRGAQLTHGKVEEKSFSKFLLACTRALARGIGSNGVCGYEDGWTTGQPQSATMLNEYGMILTSGDFEDSNSASKDVIALLRKYPDFALPAWQIDSGLPHARKWLLDALRRDPYNSQLCFELFCAVWSSKHPEPFAVQFARKAIELSPGHGKAHMVAPHAAHAKAQMLNHSELGYRLLQGNTFAINNYILNLNNSGAKADRLLRLADEGIECDPEDPGNYFRMIEILQDAQEWNAALDVALRLQKLFEPELNPRADYCLRQNPELARQMDANEYDPVENARAIINDLRKRANC